MTLHKWHRRFGVTALLVISMISVTGLFLMVLPGTELGRKEINSRAINNLYGKTPEYGPVGVNLDGLWVVQIDGTMYIGDTAVSGFNDRITGAVRLNNDIVVASKNYLRLYQPSGQLIDQIGDELLPDYVLQLGLDGNEAVVIETVGGYFTGDETLSFWTSVEKPVARWSGVEEPPKDVGDAVLAQYRGTGVPFYRIILDLHTGRLFGAFGIAIVWICTLIMLFLTVSGGIMWTKRFVRDAKKS